MTDVFEVSYPFTRGTFARFGEPEQPSWTPGTRYKPAGPEDYEEVADGVGKQILTVVSVHKPGRYPERTFYTQQWEDPDGKRFGKGKLRMTTTPTFRKRTEGFYRPYRVETPA